MTVCVAVIVRLVLWRLDERTPPVGELRAELKRGERPSRHTELREWLTR